MNLFKRYYILQFMIGYCVTYFVLSNNKICTSYDEFQELCNIFNSSGGTHWNWNNANIGEKMWKCNQYGSSDPCLDRWYGINCSNSASNCNITSIALANMNLTGTLPSKIYFKNLKYLDTADNNLYGQLPLSLPISLTYLTLSFNNFSGTIPESYGNLTNLNVLRVSGNYLVVGRIPGSIGNLKKLTNLGMRDNSLTGPIPYMLCNCNLSSILFQNNLLTGKIPDYFYNFSNLEALRLYNNSFEGTISSQVSKLSKLLIFEVEINHLTGTIPSFIGYLNKLETIDLSDNSLTGSIPSEVVNMTSLIDFNIRQNKIISNIPIGISNLAKLETFVVSSNALTGNINNVFSINQVNLSTIDISGNLLEDAIPDLVFSLPSLNTFVGSKNCFSEGISSSICNAKALKVIALDGLTSSKNCLVKSFNRISGLEGSIPECLWNLEQIEFLHIAYNGFKGRLPDKLQIKSKVLRSINLSGNKLSGSIPGSLFDRSYKELDLSRNKFVGAITERDGFTSDELVLEVNRISGRIPSKLFENVTNLSVLAGNDFMCELDQSDLPSQDSSANSYICGSFNFDVAISIFGVIFFFVLSFMFISSYRKPSYEFMLSLYKYYFISLDSLGDYPNIKAFLNILENYTMCNLIVTLVIFMVQVIAFPSLKSSIDYTTQDHQYGLDFSAAYMSGLPPVLVLFFIWIISINIYIYMISSKHAAQLASFESKIVPRTKLTLWTIVVIFATLIIVICVSIMLNIGYILLVGKSSEIVVSIIQFVFTFINMILNTVLIPHSIKHLELRVKRKVSLQSLMILFNTLIGPLISMMLSSPSCFSDLFKGIEPIFSTYPYNRCIRLDINDKSCILEGIVYFNLEFTPNFIYNNTCRNEIFKYFIPVLLLSYTYFLFVPTIVCVYLLNVKNVSSLPRGLFYLVPAILWPDEKFPNPPFQFLIDMETILFKQDIHIGLILTLGIISPPLLILICLRNFTDYATTRILILRYFKLNKDKDSLRSIEGQFEHVWRCPHNFIWYAVWFSCVFHVLFLLDMANDESNFIDTIWIIIVFPCVILMYRSTITLHKNFYSKRVVKETDYVDELEIKEIKDIQINIDDDQFKIKEIILSEINDSNQTMSPLQDHYLS